MAFSLGPLARVIPVPTLRFYVAISVVLQVIRQLRTSSGPLVTPTYHMCAGDNDPTGGQTVVRSRVFVVIYASVEERLTTRRHRHIGRTRG
jgi:hypothetical protein